MDKLLESDVVLVLGLTIEMYLNGGAYAPSICINRHWKGWAIDVGKIPITVPCI